MVKSLASVKREGAEYLDPLKAESRVTQLEHANRMIAEARECGLSLKDYLNVKIDPRLSKEPGRFAANDNLMLSGFEAALVQLNLPVRDDLSNGTSLQAAADTFTTFPGSRIMFPQVVDEVAKWKFRQTNFERLEPMVAQSRTINAPEMISVVVDDGVTDYTRPVRAISELGKFPISQIQGTDQTVKIWKFGMGYETSYEFERRISIDLLTPYAARAERRIEMSKVWEATRILVSGDGVQTAAAVIAQSTYNGVTGVNAVNGVIGYRHLLAWLVARAKAGYPIDTVVGNFDAYLQWILMFAVPQANSDGESGTETLARAGYVVRGVPILTGTVDFVLSSAVAANRLIGYSKADTLEQLIESGSQINENERSITTQKITYTKSENSGFRLVFDGTRSIFNFGA